MALYNYNIDLKNENTSHAKVLRMVGAGKHVLEIGCATGYLTQYMKETLGCRVVGIELDTDAAERAKKYCEEIFFGDVEQLSLGELLKERRFDVILLADVIEHLKAPGDLLGAMKKFLTPDGCMILSVPNGAHGSVGLELLDGKWEYRKEGLLDQTHLHFFDKDALAQMLEAGGLFISEIDRVIIHPRDSELKTPWDSYPREVTAYLEKVNPEYQTYQFVIKAYPTTSEGWERGLTEALAVEKKHSTQLQGKLEAREEEIDALRTGFDREREEMNARFQKELDRLEAEMTSIHKGYQKTISSMTAEADFLQRTLSDLRQAKAETDETLNEIYSSNAWRFLENYRGRVEKMFPLDTRRRRFYQLCILSPFVLFREGIGSFFKKILKRVFFSKKKTFNDFIHEEVTTFEPISFPFADSVTASIVIPVYNQAQHTYRCLRSIDRYTTIPFEVIVYDNASTDETAGMLSKMDNLVVVQGIENLGFVGACNEAAALARGKHIVFLNNDTQVTEGWLEALLAPFEDPGVGVVGGKLIYPDGRLQEAGNIIWQDATGWNFGRGDDPELPQYCYLREVDYCSAACLTIRKDLWQDIGGFDERYQPAYYEDTDLCFSVRKKGCKVIFQPDARILHYEGVTAGTDLNEGFKRYQQANLVKFREKWQAVLSESHFPGPQQLYLARERGVHKRALVVDHYVPMYDKDSGSLRMYSLLKIMTEIGLKVTFWPENRAADPLYSGKLQQLGVEILYGDIQFSEYLKLYGKHFDFVLLSRPHIGEQFFNAVKTFTRAKVIYDSVDLHYLREERRAAFEIDPERKRQVEAEALKWKRKELFLFKNSDAALVVSPVEKEILEGEEGLPGKISVVSNVHCIEKCKNRFAERSGLMFIGGFVHPPNEDAMVWFMQSIFPLIAEKIPGIKLAIVGSDPTAAVKKFKSKRVAVTGYVSDVTSYFENARVFISPLRYGAGVKGKIGQSLSFGLPVVTTSTGAEGMGLLDGVTAMIADDEAAFADKVVQLYRDENLWRMLSENGRNLIKKSFSPEVIKKELLTVCETGVCE